MPKISKYGTSASAAILNVLREYSDRELHLDDIAEELEKFHYPRTYMHNALATLTHDGKIRRYYDVEEKRSYWQIKE